MSAAMSGNGQHESHPDAETLSAFAEQALGKRQRGEVLEHLAACGRCRQVIALAREAAGAEVAARQRATVGSRVWFRSWGLALVPAAAIAASTVIAIYVHELDSERNAEVAKVERQQANEKAPMPPQASPPPQAQAAPPPASSPEKKAGAGRAPGEPARAAAARMQTQIEFIDPYNDEGGPILTAKEEQELDRALEEPPSPAAEAQAPVVRTQGMMGVAPAPSGTSADEKTGSEVATYDEERKRKAEAEMEARDKHLLAAMSTKLADENGARSGTAGSGGADSSERVVVTDQQLETQPAPASSAGSLMGLRAGAFSAARAANLVQLPSGLPAISMTHVGPRMLAIDKSGALFLSEDSGGTWDEVKRQWTRRATVVRRRGEEEENREAAASDSSEASQDTSGSGAVSHSDAVFELVNDYGQVWLSTDGKVWVAR